jgi:hypothetical protein
MFTVKNVAKDSTNETLILITLFQIVVGLASLFGSVMNNTTTLRLRNKLWGSKIME